MRWTISHEIGYGSDESVLHSFCEKLSENIYKMLKKSAKRKSQNVKMKNDNSQGGKSHRQKQKNTFFFCSSDHQVYMIEKGKNIRCDYVHDEMETTRHLYQFFGILKA